MSRRYSRGITVDEHRYRWSVMRYSSSASMCCGRCGRTETWGPLDLRLLVEREGGGQQAGVWFSCPKEGWRERCCRRPGGVGDGERCLGIHVISPGLVRAFILYALAGGWSPDKKGKLRWFADFADACQAQLTASRNAELEARERVLAAWQQELQDALF